MLIVHRSDTLALDADRYRLVFPADRPYVCLKAANGQTLADLYALAGVQSGGQDEDSILVGPWKVEEGADWVLFSAEVQSSVWERKLVRFRCWQTRFAYEVTVFGNGALGEVCYFGGNTSANVRWGSGFFWSGQAFKKGFNPEPGTDEAYFFQSSASSSINLTGVPLPGRADWFFTPPPFCYGFDTSSGWMGMGVEARPGMHTYSEFEYHGRNAAFYLTLAFDGQTQVQGSLTLPAIGFDFEDDPYRVLSEHVGALNSLAGVEADQPVRPAWWYEPIFCGWGAQCALAAAEGGRAPDYATQSNYVNFLSTLLLNGVDPGTVVIDDRWQATYGGNEVDATQWPDLPGFIREQHTSGRRVLLWLKAWDPQGVPVSECITNAAGKPVAVDPTNPAYEARLRSSVRRMLSDEGYGADGFKIDFTARIPCGPGLHRHGSAWGLELMHRYLYILYSEAKAVKPDALVIAHTPHPYLADVVDAIRLNDINTAFDPCRTMSHRAIVAEIACPRALVDTDNWPMPSRAVWRQYLETQPALGVPALYFVDRIDSTQEPLEPEDYASIRRVWDAYRSALALNGIRPMEGLPAVPKKQAGGQ